MTRGGGPRVLTMRQGRLGEYAEGLERAAAAALERAGRLAGLGKGHELSLLICDNAAIRILNRRWRKIDKPTDVLSFPMQALKPGGAPAAGPVGDIAIALPYARRAAREEGLDAAEHVEHLAVHGLLHLLGHDHMNEREAGRMRREEERLLGRKLR